jgi:Fic family protein
MDTIIYSSAATLLIGIFFETTRNINTLFVSNTKLIIRQGEQIQFLLTRVIELDKKIKKMKEEIEMNNSIDLDIIQEEEEETEEEKETKKEKEGEKEEEEILFEIVESAPVKTQKEKGWIRYLF